MKDLNRYTSNVTSQNGEDGIITRLLELIGETEAKWCVEFGAWDGKYLSNTYNLWHNRGYNAVLIEADNKKYNFLENEVKGNPGVHPIHAFVGYDKENNLDNILARINITKEFDVLSIDIDGDDYYVWEAFLNYKPRIVVIESNSSYDYDIDRVGSSNDSPKGSSARALVKLGKKKGYELVAHTGNCIFVREDLFGKVGIIDNSVEKLFKPAWLSKWGRMIHIWKRFIRMRFKSHNLPML